MTASSTSTPSRTNRIIALLCGVFLFKSSNHNLSIRCMEASLLLTASGPVKTCFFRWLRNGSLCVLYHRARPSALPSYPWPLHLQLPHHALIQLSLCYAALFLLNKSSNHRLSISRSQYGGCSTAYNTWTSKQVVYKRFCTPTLYQSIPALATRQLSRAIEPGHILGHYAVDLKPTYIFLPTYREQEYHCPV